MLAATSVLPLLGVGAGGVVLLTIVQTRRLMRSVGATDGVAELTFEGDAAELKCGFDLRAPGRLTASYPLATLRISDHFIDVLGPLGAYRFGRDASVGDVTHKLVTYRMDLATADVRLRVLLRDPGAVRSALQRYGWTAA